MKQVAGRGSGVAMGIRVRDSCNTRGSNGRQGLG